MGNGKWKKIVGSIVELGPLLSSQSYYKGKSRRTIARLDVLDELRELGVDTTTGATGDIARAAMEAFEE
jgi:hypothetical protein